jgi:hypothetical protein
LEISILKLIRSDTEATILIKMTSFLDPSARVSRWTEIPSEDLEAMLNTMYWESLTRELGVIILSLKHLKDVPPVPEEEDIMKRVAAEAAYFAAAWSRLSTTT